MSGTAGDWRLLPGARDEELFLREDRPFVLPAVPIEGFPLGQVALRISDSTLYYCGGDGLGKRAAWALFEQLVEEANAFDRSYIAEARRDP